VHALMGPNGAGKSTLANIVMATRGYTVTGGEILLNGANIAKWTPDERARAGIFLAFQYPEGHRRCVGRAVCVRRSPLERASTNSASSKCAWTRGWMDRWGWTGFAERHLTTVLRRRAQAQRVLQMALLETGRRVLELDRLRLGHSTPFVWSPRACARSR